MEKSNFTNFKNSYKILEIATTIIFRSGDQEKKEIYNSMVKFFILWNFDKDDKTQLLGKKSVSGAENHLMFWQFWNNLNYDLIKP